MGQSHGENSAGTGPSSPLPSAAESIEYSITMTAINREIIATQWQWTNLWQPFQLFFSRGNLYHCLGNVEPQCAVSTLERFYKRWLNEEQRATFFLTPHKPSQLHKGGGEVRGRGQRGHCSSTPILTETEKEKKKKAIQIDNRRVFDPEHKPSLLKREKVFMIRDEWQPSTNVINMQMLGANTHMHADTLTLAQI